MAPAADDIWDAERPRNIACIGEAMIELSFPEATASLSHVGVAGDVFNTAVYIERNGGGDVAFVSATGTDSMSDRLIAFAGAEELDCSLIARVDHATIGLYAITTDEHGERSFTYWRENSAARQLFNAATGPDMGALLRYEAIYLSAITLAILPAAVRGELIDWLQQYRTHHGGRVIFDSNYRPSLWSSPQEARREIARAWTVADIGLPTLEDELALFGEGSADAVLARLRAAGVATGALKCGRAGPLPIADTLIENIYPVVDDVVDTTAAGDSFNGGFLAAWIRGKTYAEALLAGHEQACSVLCHHGAFGR